MSTYQFTESLSAAQWAWEFLRRNNDYQKEWLSFIETWRLLESRYGKAPNRNFTQWKQDPLAWVDLSQCEQGDCRVDDNKVLIECAMGAKWGFYKFPPDPEDDDPVGNNRLNWRPVESEIDIIQLNDVEYLGDKQELIALGFDLSLPLVEQLEKAKRKLQMEQRNRVKNKQIERLTVKTKCELWTHYLRSLDGVDGLNNDVLQEEALYLVKGGYLDILSLPSG